MNFIINIAFLDQKFLYHKLFPNGLSFYRSKFLRRPKSTFDYSISQFEPCPKRVWSSPKQFGRVQNSFGPIKGQSIN